jgi:hypothetical protein
MPHSPLNYIVLDLDRQEELQTNGQGEEVEEKGEKRNKMTAKRRYIKVKV